MSYDENCCTHINPELSFSDSSSYNSRSDYLSSELFSSSSSSSSSSSKSSEPAKKIKGELEWIFPCSIFSNNMDKCVEYDYRGCQWNCFPTTQPTDYPTLEPTFNPSNSPTFSPTLSPTDNPIQAPTLSPTISPTNEPTNYPTYSPTSYICSDITSCGKCAIITDCIWCNNTCQYEKEECYDEDLSIDEEYGCDDYNPVSNCGMDTNEVLTYRILLKSCSVVQSNQSFVYIF